MFGYFMEGFFIVKLSLKQVWGSMDGKGKVLMTLEKYGWKDRSRWKGKSIDEKGEVFNKRITYESEMVEKKRVKYKSKGRSMSAMVEKSTWKERNKYKIGEKIQMKVI